MLIDEAGKGWRFLAIKMNHVPWWGGRRKSLLSGRALAVHLSYIYREGERERAKIIEGMSKQKEIFHSTQRHHQHAQCPSCLFALPVIVSKKKQHLI